jgi:hypothetical protein
MGRLLALVVMVAGTVALALLANRAFGLPGLIIAGAIGLLITACTLRL